MEPLDQCVYNTEYCDHDNATDTHRLLKALPSTRKTLTLTYRDDGRSHNDAEVLNLISDLIHEYGFLDASVELTPTQAVA